MGTRADFYIQQEKVLNSRDWLGSIAWDGYPEGVDDAVLKAKTAEEFKVAVDAFLTKREDATRPDQGWPWPWDDSRTTDYAYIFVKNKVRTFCFGRAKGKEVKSDLFPDMTAIQKVDFGKRSGVMILGLKNE